MKYIATASQMKDVDKYLIEKENYDLYSLVQLASLSLFEELKLYKKPLFLIGPGNNGADALALIKLMIKNNCNVSVLKTDFKYNQIGLSFIEECINKINFTEDYNGDFDVIIDGLFGNGLDRPLDNNIIKLIKQINEINCDKIAIDMPTGINATKGILQDVAFKADKTITFMCDKLAFLNKDLADYFGVIIVKPFGIEQNALQQCAIAKLFETKDAMSIIKPFSHDGHKGTRGKVVHYTGSDLYVGAPVLAAKAALYTGTGLVKLSSTFKVLQLASLNSLELLLEEYDYNKIDLSKYDSILCGSGSDKNHDTAMLVNYLIEKATVPLVLDADALNVISEDTDILLKKQTSIVLTPHLIEFKRLVKDYENLENAIMSFSKKYDVIMVVKGPNTIVCYHDVMYRNTTGNPGMSVGGMGDVLAGIISSFCGQGYDPLDAALLSVFIHGLAGDEIYKTNNTVIPSKLIEIIPKVTKTLLKNPSRSL